MSRIENTKYILTWRLGPNNSDQRIHQKQFLGRKMAEEYLDDLKKSPAMLSEWCLREHTTTVSEVVLDQFPSNKAKGNKTQKNG